MHTMQTFLSRTALLGVVALSSAASLAQWSDATDPQHVAHQRAVEAYQTQQYALALHDFESLMASAASESSDAYVEANYYAAMSSLALYHRDAVYRVESFVEKFPESPLALEAPTHTPLALMGPEQ